MATPGPATKREAKNPERALDKARDDEQREEMADDMDEARRDARESGEYWSDIKDEWIEDWSHSARSVGVRKRRLDQVRGKARRRRAR